MTEENTLFLHFPLLFTRQERSTSFCGLDVSNKVQHELTVGVSINGPYFKEESLWDKRLRMSQHHEFRFYGDKTCEP